MQLDCSIQEWLESFGEPVADTAFSPRDENGNIQSVSVPYIIFLDEIDVDGSDDTNLYSAHDLTIERYSQTGDNKKFDCFLWKSGLKFTRSKKQWLPSEQLFLTVYNITEPIITKNGVDKNGEYTEESKENRTRQR